MARLLLACSSPTSDEGMALRSPMRSPSGSNTPASSPAESRASSIAPPFHGATGEGQPHGAHTHAASPSRPIVPALVRPVPRRDDVVPHAATSRARLEGGASELEWASRSTMSRHSLSSTSRASLRASRSVVLADGSLRSVPSEDRPPTALSPVVTADSVIHPARTACVCRC